MKTLLLDIGGVVLTKGWGHESRALAAERFGLNRAEMEERHHAALPPFEEGRITLDQYLAIVVFYENRDFSVQEFKKFMHDQSQVYPEVLEFFRLLKDRLGLRVVAVSNEGRELTVYRIDKFGLASLFDFFVSSCFVCTRKPDPAIYKLTLDMLQASPDQVVYVDDTLLHVEEARRQGIPSIHHTDLSQTRAELAQNGLVLPGG